MKKARNKDKKINGKFFWLLFLFCVSLTFIGVYVLVMSGFAGTTKAAELTGFSNNDTTICSVVENNWTLCWINLTDATSVSSATMNVTGYYDYSNKGSYTGFNFSLPAGESFPTGIVWNGSNFYVVGIDNDVVYEFDSDGVYTGFNFSIIDPCANSRGLTWNGSSFFCADTNSDVVYEFDGAGVYTGFNWSLCSGGCGDSPQAIAWSNPYFYVIEGSPNTVMRYTRLV